MDQGQTTGVIEMTEQERRALLVAQLKRQVQNGTYQVDASALAEALVSQGVVTAQKVH